MEEVFHAHLYFDAETRESALRIREQLREATDFGVDLQPVREAPLGPHPSPMFNSHLDYDNFGRAMRWLMLNHGPHSVLIHPNTDDPVADHTRHALWLGPSLPLNLQNL